MVQVILVTPGETDFDQQRRIAGNLDIPLNQAGVEQAQRIAHELDQGNLDAVYTAPNQAALETGRAVAERSGAKHKVLPNLANLDHGLWQGKLESEVRSTQRKVYRQWKEQPETVCPPEGESLELAVERVKAAVNKLLRKHKQGRIAVVVPEPIAGLVQCQLTRQPIGDRWQSGPGCGGWQLVDLDRIADKAVVHPELVAAE